MTLITLFYCVKHHKEINALKCLFLVYAPILKYLVIVLNLQLKANKIEIVILLRFLQFSPKDVLLMTLEFLGKEDSKSLFLMVIG